MPTRGSLRGRKRYSKGNLASVAKKLVSISRSKPRVSVPVKKYVKKTVAGHPTQKMVDTNYADQPMLETLGVGSFAILVPQIPRGDSEANRDGNTVRVRSLIVRGHVNVTPYNVATNILRTPHFARIWIGRLQSTILSPIAGDIAGLLEINAGAGAWQGLPIDLHTRTNNDLWKIVYTKTFKLGNNGDNPAFQVYSGSDHKLSGTFRFNLTKKLPKVLKFDDGVNACTNAQYYIFGAVCALDRTQLGPLEAPSQWHAVSTLTYTN